MEPAGRMKAQSFLGPRALGAIVAVCAAAADQASKYWLLNVFDIERRQPVRLARVFDVVLAWNRGISYSLLTTSSNRGRLLLLAGALAITIVLGAWMWRSRSATTSIALGLIVGGALGNAFDRWQRGAVADFFFFHVGSFRWYVFNLADCAIVAGVALLLYDSYRSAEPPPAREPRVGE
jgi:signal peptidase II